MRQRVHQSRHSQPRGVGFSSLPLSWMAWFLTRTLRGQDPKQHRACKSTHSSFFCFSALSLCPLPLYAADGCLPAAKFLASAVLPRYYGTSAQAKASSCTRHGVEEIVLLTGLLGAAAIVSAQNVLLGSRSCE